MSSMASFSTDLATWSYGVATLGFAAFTLQLGLGWRGGARGGWVLTAIAFSACWAATETLHAITGLQGLGITANLFDTLRICAWFGFLLSLLFYSTQHQSGKRKRVPLWVAGSIGVLVAGSLGLIFAPLFAPAILGVVARLSFFTSLALTIVGLTLIEQFYRNLPAQSRWGVKPLCLGLGGMFCFDLYMFTEALLFNQINLDVWTSRGIANLFVVPFVAVSSARNKDWTIKISVSRKLVFHSTALFAAGLYLVGIAGIGYYVRYFGGTWGGALEVTFLFGGLLAMGYVSISGSLRSKLRVLVNKNFFSYRYDYREEWLRFTQSLAAVDPHVGLLEQPIKALADLLESPGGSLWLADPSGSFAQVSRLNMPNIDELEPRTGALASFLAGTHWVMDLSEFAAKPENYPGFEPPLWLQSLENVWLVVPLTNSGELIGFVVLARPRAKIELDWEVLDLLKTAARQAASYIAYTRATEALLESKKFDAFNHMSAFVVHDVKNLVAQLSLLLKNAERHKDNQAFQADMLTTIGHAVERMKQLLTQLRAGSTPDNQPSPVGLASIIGRIGRSRGGFKPPLTVAIDGDIEVMGHADRLERVIGHLVQNAVDATPEDGRIWLKLLRDKGLAIVEVGDTGHGMSREFVRERMFKPFRSTKASGMGIGAYESSKYIGELGGKISVDSRENIGTVVRIELLANEPNVALAQA